MGLECKDGHRRKDLNYPDLGNCSTTWVSLKSSPWTCYIHIIALVNYSLLKLKTAKDLERDSELCLGNAPLSIFYYLYTLRYRDVYW